MAGHKMLLVITFSKMSCIGTLLETGGEKETSHEAQARVKKGGGLPRWSRVFLDVIFYL